MGLRQRPFQYLIAFSAIALALAVLPAITVVSGVTASCVTEFCSVPQTLAMIAISFLALVWLVLVVLTAWSARDGQPRIAAWGALAAAFWLVVLAALDTGQVLTPGAMDSPMSIFDQLVPILVIGVSLVPIWRLATLARPVPVGRAISLVAGLAALASGYAYVVLGYTPFNGGPQIQFLAYLAFCGGLAVLAAASWSSARMERPGLAVLGAGALLFFVIGTFDYLDPAESTSILVIAEPVMALGWLWIGVAWLRVGR